jgi:UDPglucose 6-dehydrogenase
MKITIFGSGYVGLVTGACFADTGNQVLCVDVDAAKVERLREGHVPIFEPGLEAIVARNVRAGRLEFTTDAAAGVEHGLFQMIAVGTPPDEDGSADLQHVLTVAGSIGEHMREYRIVVMKSTVPVGTADRVRERIRGVLSDRELELEVDVVSNPEFLKEGAAVADVMKPDRIVVGTDNPRTAELLRLLYDPFTRSREKLMVMDVRSAELTKYAANAMLATKISFMNELANIAERCGADIENVRMGIGSDPRIGYHFIYAGAGYGGSCFPKDVRALTRSGESLGYEPELLRAVERVNERQKRHLFERIESYFKGRLAGRTLALWGLAFKPNTDDMRLAPSRAFMEDVWQTGARVRAYDPVAMDEARRIYGERDDLTLCASAMDAVRDADALVVVTEWSEFRSPDFEQIKRQLREPVIFDGRNIYDPAYLARLGIRYYSIGRPAPAEA